MTRSDIDVIELKKRLLENNNFQKLLMHYRIIMQKNNDNAQYDFNQNEEQYNDNKYVYNNAFDIKQEYLQMTLSNEDIQNNLHNNINDTLNAYDNLIDDAMENVLEYLTRNNINEYNIDRIINRYIDKLYISLDARNSIENNMHYINEDLIFSEEDKNMIDNKLSSQYIKEEYLNNENN